MRRRNSLFDEMAAARRLATASSDCHGLRARNDKVAATLPSVAGKDNLRTLNAGELL